MLDESAPLVDGTPLLDRPWFWAAHLSMATEDGLVEEAFGLPAATGRSRLADPARWPYFEVPLNGGGVAFVIYENMLDTGQIPEYSRVLVIDGQAAVAWIAGCACGPGLSWPELEGLRRAPEADFGVLDPDQRMLLALPMLGDLHVPGHAVEMVTAALQGAGAGPGADALAAALVGDHARWKPSTWQTTPDGITTCDGEHSPRNPFSANAVDQRAVSGALRP
ncbi:hypothetical protein F8566_27845 [Actinomadura rudentiformis]|uniref:Uncharacterized protein n=1 Tax=Actinomadura rudentiformis TaxID=359158 RepID=A0A6H9YKN0_9ACTN|nr:hypothetical protein F8566_27845 [Actinomadura rudentiformis]